MSSYINFFFHLIVVVHIFVVLISVMPCVAVYSNPKWGFGLYTLRPRVAATNDFAFFLIWIVPNFFPFFFLNSSKHNIIFEHLVFPAFFFLNSSNRQYDIRAPCFSVNPKWGFGLYTLCHRVAATNDFAFFLIWIVPIFSPFFF